MFDAIVIGGGIIGLSAAFNAVQRGLDVLVLDATTEGKATTAAAGMLAPVTEANWWEEDLAALNFAGARLYPAFLSELNDASGQQVKMHPRSTSYVALTRDHREALERFYAFQQSKGHDAKWLERDELREMEPFLHPSAQCGIFAPSDAAVDPREIEAGLREALSGRIRTGDEGTAMELLITSGRCTGVRTKTEDISAANIVLAAGCRSGSIEGAPEIFAKSIRPVKGQILRLRPRNDERLIASNIRTDDVYLVPRSTGEVVVGATVEEQGFDATPTAGAVLELLRAADEAVPGLREFHLVEAGAGLRPGTPDNLPLVGPTELPGLIAATGHYRNGILLAPLTAQTIAAHLTEDKPPAIMDGVSPSRFR